MILILFLLSSSFSQATVVEHVPEGCSFLAEEGLNFYECKDHGLNYYVSVPDGCSAGGCGLILDLPGYTMTATSQNALTGIRAKGNAAGYIVVTAETVGLNWRPTDTSWQGNTDNLVEDIGALVEVFDVDEEKIHATGFSQGCQMTWMLLHAMTDDIASVACLGASGHDSWAVEDIVEKRYKNEMASKPKRAVMYHTGKFDYTSLISDGRSMRRKVKAWLENFEFQFKKYPMKNTVPFYPDVPYVPGDKNTAAEGHCIPATSTLSASEMADLNDYDQLLYTLLVCPVGSESYDWGQEVVDFFVANPKPDTNEYSQTVCDAPTGSAESVLFVLSQWHVNIVVYGFALFGLFSSMMFLFGKHKNDFTPVEQNNEL